MLTGNLEKIAEHGRRADGIVKSMLAHSRGGHRRARRIDLNALVEEALNLAYHGARAQDQNFNITLERDFDTGSRRSSSCRRTSRGCSSTCSATAFTPRTSAGRRPATPASGRSSR